MYVKITWLEVREKSSTSSVLGRPGSAGVNYSLCGMVPVELVEEVHGLDHQVTALLLFNLLHHQPANLTELHNASD